MKHIIITAAIIAAAVLSLNGCFIRRGDEPITLDNSDPLALAPDIQWAVITDPYAAFRTSPDWNAAVTGHCRRAAIYQILGSSVSTSAENGTEITWYNFTDGWLPESVLSVQSNKLQAQTLAATLK